MRLHAVRLLPLAAVFFVTLGVSASSDRREAARLDDTYAVFSAILDRPCQSEVDNPERLKDHLVGFGLFTLTTDEVWPRESDETDMMECLTIPEKTRRELVADMEAHRFHHVRIPSSRLSMTRPYGRLHGSGPGGRNRVLVRLGYVYFNADRTIAAAYADVSYGILGGEGSWQVFARQPDGAWKATPRAVRCGWVS